MKIICVGRNYIEHAEELHHAVPAKPLFFFKPDTALTSGEDFYLPSFAERFEYECELVVKICKVGKCIDRAFAKNYYNEVAIGLDITARDIQQKEISQGLPWTLSKAFDYSAPVSEFIPLSSLGKEITNLDFALTKNGIRVQEANTGSMIFSVDEIIAYVSQFVTLKVGDLIFTGTPQGVGSININDHFAGYLEARPLLNLTIK
ncbi:MAG: fumarylacetoacetate hydrolase family protein [Bacteroidales bacterium]|jgi:2-keto-4-pentenoate hydratase/2-oxohepta-3-ene-1,7-dioic acid hydratase in catechol pathway|nr:fumarylacetoacetate hydrolase family protein [Bacteroidales bacterium]